MTFLSNALFLFVAKSAWLNGIEGRKKRKCYNNRSKLNVCNGRLKCIAIANKKRTVPIAMTITNDIIITLFAEIFLPTLNNPVIKFNYTLFWQTRTMLNGGTRHSDESNSSKNRHKKILKHSFVNAVLNVHVTSLEPFHASNSKIITEDRKKGTKSERVKDEKEKQNRAK